MKIENSKSYKIHNTVYKCMSNNEFDILQGYNKKYKMKVTLLFPKKQDKAVDNK
jgi:hypothetical protein